MSLPSSSFVSYCKSVCLHYRLILSSVAIIGVIWYAHGEFQSEQSYAQAAAATEVTAPHGAPPITQESIDLAMQIYGITVPSGAEPPMLDLDMKDRGLTTRSPFMDKARVTIGPAAFGSWSLLGSTLAHEIEVHCKQNFLAIYLMDLMGMDGTGTAERQAYLHELSNADRFGTATDDARMIADTVAFYYPEEQAARPGISSSPVKAWVARAFLGASATSATN